MRLTPPTKITFWVSVVVGALGFLGMIGVVGALTAWAGWMLFAAWLLLILGLLLKGL